jgi:hypothetical protein
LAVVTVEAPLDADCSDWSAAPEWNLWGELRLGSEGQPVVERHGLVPNRLNSLDLPTRTPPNKIQRKATAARVLEVFRRYADRHGFSAEFGPSSMVSETLARYRFDPDEVTKPVAPQRRGLARHAGLIRRVIELSEQGVDHPMLGLRRIACRPVACASDHARGACAGCG